MRKLQSPSQVVRYDGNKVFMEMMCDGLSINRIFLNFCQYDKAAKKGSRMTSSIAIYLEVGKAAVLAESILNGELAAKAKESRLDAEQRKSNYPNPVFVSMGGSKPQDVGRPDGKAESRQFKIVPGNKLPWLITAEKGPGHVDPSGLIVPEYTTARGSDAVIRIPMTDESLYSFALHLKELFSLWMLEKYGNVNRFDPAALRGYDPATGMKKTSLVARFEQEPNPVADADRKINPALRMGIHASALPIDKILMEFTTSDWTVKSSEDKALLPIFLDISKGNVLATDILSGRIAALAARQKKTGTYEPVYLSLGGTNKNGKIESRQFKIFAGNTQETKDKWILQAEKGPGHLSDTGLFVPDYTEKTAECLYQLCIGSDELKRFALCIRDMAMLWMIKKFGPVIQPGIDERRQNTENEIAKLRVV